MGVWGHVLLSLGECTGYYQVEEIEHFRVIVVRFDLSHMVLETALAIAILISQ